MEQIPELAWSKQSKQKVPEFGIAPSEKLQFFHALALGDVKNNEAKV